MSTKANQLTPAMRQALDAVLDKHLKKNPIWQGNFFTSIEQEPDPQIRWKLLETWIDQMPHASYGFTTYVSYLSARARQNGFPQVRELLSQNLHEEHTSPASHFRMICALKAKVLGKKGNILVHDFDSLLPTSRAHVKTHINIAQNADFLQGLGTLLLIENLTAEEFRRVREACSKTWGELGKQPDNYFNGGGGEGYFKANEDADEGHAIDMMIAVQTALEAEGVDVSDPEAIKPYIERITKGVITSITCRTNFVEGVYYKAIGKENEFTPLEVPFVPEEQRTSSWKKWLVAGAVGTSFLGGCWAQKAVSSSPAQSGQPVPIIQSTR